jgi:hypothetical protein
MSLELVKSRFGDLTPLISKKLDTKCLQLYIKTADEELLTCIASLLFQIKHKIIPLSGSQADYVNQRKTILRKATDIKIPITKRRVLLQRKPTVEAIRNLMSIAIPLLTKDIQTDAWRRHEDQNTEEDV